MSKHRLPNTALAAFLRDRRSALRTTDFESLRTAGGRSSLSQEQVAELIGVSRQWYLKFEAGHLARPTLSLIGRVAAALRLDDADALRLLHLAAANELPAAASAACVAQSTVETASSALDDRAALDDQAISHIERGPAAACAGELVTSAHARRHADDRTAAARHFDAIRPIAERRLR